MAITRRQFVTRLGALAATVGFSQAEVSKLAEAFAGTTYNPTKGWGGKFGKPRVIWIHGAECTGCSTSLLGILESAGGHPLYGNKNLTLYNADPTKSAYNLAKIAPSATPFGAGSLFTLWSGAANQIEGGKANMNIADVVIDVIDLQYHETVMGMGGDLAAQWLNDFAGYNPTGLPADASKPGESPFVLVVEGALQPRFETDGTTPRGGAWNDTSDTHVPWCSIGMADDSSFEIDMSDTVRALAKKKTCAAIIPIGQCAAFGGYPGCKAPISAATSGSNAPLAKGFDATKSQTGAMGVSAFLSQFAVGTDERKAAAKVINVPGCPTNPWWFVLTVVLFMADYIQGGVLGIIDPGTKLPMATAVDKSGRLKAVYPIPVHSGWCPRYKYYTKGQYAAKPGDPGCLQKLGCKGIGTFSLCGTHGWNNQQPENGADEASGSLAYLNAGGGGHCTQAGHPCMACTEKGYPDSFVPFVRF